MSMYLFPNYLSFIKNEKKTLNFLMNSPIIRKLYGEIALSASHSYHNLPNKDKLLSTSNFIFGCHFDLEVEGLIRKIIIEAKVEKKFTSSSYVLSLCENQASPFNLIRKFHFDYAIPDNSPPKPVYHFQYGGKSTPILTDLSIDIKNLQPWLSDPRISIYPINLALLLDSIFCGFRSNETNQITNSSEWRSLIKENEDIILKPFYLNIHQFINNKHKSDFLIRDYNNGKV